MKDVYSGNDRRDQHWTLDKRVPIVLIAVLCGQLFGFGWWASDLSSRVGNIEVHQKESFATKDWAVGEHKVIKAEIASTNKTTKSIRNTVLRMENKIDKMYDLILLNGRVKKKN